MTEVVNTAQEQAWNGYEGEHWARHRRRYDAVNSGFNGFLLDAAGTDDRVLDLGCGTGAITVLAARKARHATGIDLSAPMLDAARQRAHDDDVANVSFERGDVQVFPFVENAFDVALSRFGVMFYSDPVAAFGNVRRALRPGGRLAFVCMTALEGTDLGTVFGALTPYLPRPTGPDGTGPTSFADPDHTRSVLSASGFADITCDHVEADELWGSDVEDATEFIAGWGPVRHHMAQVPAPTAELAHAALSEALVPFAGPDGVRLRGTAWLVQAGRS